MRVLITGGNGNIAKMINKGLSDEFFIFAPSRNELNVLNFNEICEFLSKNKFDILVHTCILGGRRTKQEDGDVAYTNILMFENILKFANHFKMIINLDSGAIYDRKTDILNRKEEDLYTVPIDYYGFSKYVIYNRSLSYSNIFNFRIFNIFHANEEQNRFISSCFNAKNNNLIVDIHEDKFFDFMYEEDFLRIVRFYFQNFENLEILKKTVNIGYEQKYRLSDIAKIIIKDDSKINIIKSTANNYSGCVDKLYSYCIKFDGLYKGLQLYEEKIINNK
jgi:nucleoside-diphosphate-sugar epimerase